jgi:tetratricopeptide (TPR) repeat protein
MLRQYPEAEARLQEACAILDKPQAPDTTHLADVLANLGNLYHATHRDNQALDYYQRAIQIQETTLGPNSPRLIPVLEAYAAALRQSQDYASAEKAEVRAMGIHVRETLRSQQ